MKQEKIAGVAKVIGLSKLKGKYEPFEAKRQLCNSYDLFVADDRVVPSLPKLIGLSAMPILQLMCGVVYWLAPLPALLSLLFAFKKHVILEF